MKKNLSFALIETSEPGNIGSACRVLSNFGFLPEQLVLVSPTCTFDEGKAWAMAGQSKHWLSKLSVHQSIDELLPRFSRLVGTTAVSTLWRKQSSMSPRDYFVGTRNQDSASTLILFGSEHHGLSHEHLLLCDELITIPSHSDYPTLNLAMSLGLIAYEASLSEQIVTQVKSDLISSDLMKKVCEGIFKAGSKVGFFASENPWKLQMGLRRLLGRACLTRQEAQWILGFSQQVQDYVSRHDVES